jgi:hypothetical protein
MMFVWIGVLCAVLCGVTIGAHEMGRRIGRYQLAHDPSWPGSTIVDGAVFALLGLLLAFSFNGAASRFAERKQLIIAETNAISTAYLRLDLLPAEAQPPVRALFGEYVDARLAAYRALPDLEAAHLEIVHGGEIQRAIWDRAVAAVRAAPPYVPMLLMASLNNMFDAESTRVLMAQVHPPKVIFGMLASLIVISSMFAGHSLAGYRRSWTHAAGLAATLAVTVYVIFELEFPRFGLVRIDAMDRALIELRQAMR